MHFSLNYLRRFWHIALILLAGICIRAIYITIPLLTASSNRELFTAYNTRDMFLRGNNPFTYYPIDRPFEFPIYNFLVSMWYPFFGVQEVIGRIVSLMISIAGFFLFIRLCNYVLPKKTVLPAAIIFFLLSPVHIIMSRSFQPEILLLFFLLTYLNVMFHWTKTKKTLWILVAFLSGAFAVIIKPPSIVILSLPTIILFLGDISTPKKDALLRLTKSIFLLFCIASIAIFYLLYETSLIRANTSLSEEKIGSMVQSYLELHYLLLPTFYINAFYTLSEYVLTPIGLILSLIGLFWIWMKRHVFMLSLVASSILYIFASASRTMTHQYYFLQILPIGAMLGGLGYRSLIEKNIPFFNRWRLILLIIVIMAVTGRPYILSSYRIDPRHVEIPTTISEIKKVIPHDAKILFSSGRNDALFYYADFPHGKDFFVETVTTTMFLEPKTLDHEIETPNIIKLRDAVKEGYEYYAVSDLRVLDRDEFFLRYLLQTYEVLHYSHEYVLFKFR